MTFVKGNSYLLTKVDSSMKNPLHDKMVGRICELRSMAEHEFGWFNVEMDDGIHTVCTSIINGVSMDDDDTLTVTTANSTYTFVMIRNPLNADRIERMCEPDGV